MADNDSLRGDPAAVCDDNERSVEDHRECDAVVSPAVQRDGIRAVSALRSVIESILLVADSPVDEDTLARITGGRIEDVRDEITAMSQEYAQRGSGIDVRRSDNGWRLYTTPGNAAAVERFMLDGAQSKLSRAALETLAVVAYRQPATRAQVSAVRGVNVDGVMRTLTLRGLIEDVGADPVTGAHLYATTELFLEQIGIDSLEALPDLAPLLPDIDAIDALEEQL